MASAALSRPQPAAAPFTASPSGSAVTAHDLCDDLLAHMLDCELCLDPAQPPCAACMSLQNDIKAQRGPATGVVFAY